MKINVLDVYIDALTKEQAGAKIQQFVGERAPRRVITANPELIYQTQHNEQLRETINTADLVTADGEGVVWAARFLGTPVPERVTGIDLVQVLLPLANSLQWRIFLLGAAPGVAAAAAAKLKQQFPEITFAYQHGYFQQGEEEKAVLSEIKQFAPHLLLAGLGAPRQDQWIARYYKKLGVPVSIGVGGSFDVLSGRLKRAPRWTQQLKIEWLYRLVRQPKRITRQINLPKFMLQTIYSKFVNDPQKK